MDVKKMKKNIVIKSRLIRSVIIATLVSAMILSSLQSISANTSMIKNNSELKEDIKNPERGTIRTVPNPYPTIQAAIDASNNGDVVVVYQEGSPYQGNGNRDIDFHGKSITVRSTAGYEDGNPNGSTGFWNTVQNTIIDCQGSISNLHRGFYFHSSETVNSIVRGFKIINAVSPNAISQYWDIPYMEYYEHFGGGGAIVCVNSNPLNPSVLLSPTIEYNIFENNKAYVCGGINDIDVYCGGGAILCVSSSPRISQNKIQNNLAWAPINDYSGWMIGGGILCAYHDKDDHNPIIENNTISNNIAVDEYNNYDFGYGGGIGCLYSSSPTIQYNQIEGNQAGDEGSQPPDRGGDSRDCHTWGYSAGGGIYLSMGCNPIITHNIISNNNAIAEAWLGCWGNDVTAYGGGIYSCSYPNTCKPTFTYNTVVGNKAIAGNLEGGESSHSTASGGGFYGQGKNVYSYHPLSERDTFCYNTFIDNYAIAQAVGGFLGTIAYGGALSFSSCGSYSDPLYFHDNLVKNNHATASSTTALDKSSEAYGGGISIQGSLVAIYNSDIIGNEAVVPSGVNGYRAAYGGGIAGLSLFVDRCRILNNQVRVEQQSCGSSGSFEDPSYNLIPACGGGIAVTGEETYITNCMIAGNIVRANNQTDTLQYKALGGGVAIADIWPFNLDQYQTWPRFGSNTIVGNEVHTTALAGNDIHKAYGGGIGFSNFPNDHYPYNQYLTNCIIWDNIADTGHGEQIAALTNSNEGVYARHCDIKGGAVSVFFTGWFKWGPPGQENWPGDGNNNSDPMFIDPDGLDNNPFTWEDNDYHIQFASPCKNHGGEEDKILVRDMYPDYDGDGGTVQDPVPYDFDNEMRACGTVDIGADEIIFLLVKTEPASDIGFTFATLNGNLEILHPGLIAAVCFEWGQTTNYGQTTSEQSLSSPGPFSDYISFPQTQHIYHFRAKARVNDQIVYGEDQTFVNIPNPYRPYDITSWHDNDGDKNKGIAPEDGVTPSYSYTYRTITESARLPNAHYQLYYTFYWDDGTSTQVGPLDKNQYASASHVWASPGVYSITVTMKIGSGTESNPSLPQDISLLYLRGDTNGDGIAGKGQFADINPFVTMFSGKSAYYTSYPNGYYYTGDCTLDNPPVINFADINPFVFFLSNGYWQT